MLFAQVCISIVEGNLKLQFGVEGKITVHNIVGIFAVRTYLLAVRFIKP